MASNANKCELKYSTDSVIPTEKKLSLTVEKCLKNIVQKENFKFYSVETRDISTNGGNYLGLLQTVDLKGKGPDGDKEINLFIKNVVNTGDDFNLLNLSEVYSRESFFYKEVLTIYDNLQDEYQIPNEERFKTIKCFSDVNSEVIILENMTKKGFETGNRRDVMSLKFAEMAISQLAKFHALSFVLQEKQPNYFEKNIKNMKTVFKFDSSWKELITKLVHVAIDCLEGDAKVKLNNFLPIFLEKYEGYNKIPKEEAVCLGHLDFRPNNILQKKINGEVTEVIVIDYQFVNYTSPVLDLIYFIFSGTDQQFRDTYMEHLKNIYYDTLESFLRYFDIRSADVYSRKRFEADFKEKLDFGLLTFTILMPFLFTTDDDVPDLCDLDINPQNTSFSLDNGYKQRITEIVEFFIREGYVN